MMRQTPKKKLMKPSKDDVARARAYVNSMDWQFAKTMPQWPHWWVLRENGIAREFDFVKRLIKQFGCRDPWGRRTKYSFVMGRLKYWVDEDCLNRGAPISNEEVKKRGFPNAPPSIPREERMLLRMPTMAEKKALLERDGHHCRFCGIPVIRETIRQRIKAVYPNALSWGRTNLTQHAAFQAMWVQYDHLLPHAIGGDNSLDNMVITCAPCNFGRMNYCLEEVGLIDPRTRELERSSWDELERFR
jgi:hypothetical protein